MASQALIGVKFTKSNKKCGAACRCQGVVLKEGLPIEVSLALPPFECSVCVTAQPDGRYRCSYTPERPGFFRLEVTSQGKPLAGGVFSVQVCRVSGLCRVSELRFFGLGASGGFG